MATDLNASRTRRSFLAAATAAAAATMVSAIERPIPARAGSDGDVVLGAENTSTTPTTITCTPVFTTVGPTAFQVVVNGGPRSVAIYAENPANGAGAWGHAQNGVGVHGTVFGGDGILGECDSGRGVRGYSGSGIGVVGHSGSEAGNSAGGSIGVHGWAATDTTACGVNGESTAGKGVRGKASTGVGVYGESVEGMGVHAVSESGTALKVNGIASFSRSGRASVRAGRSHVDVNLASNRGLSGAPLCFANLQRYKAGVFVAAVRPNYPNANQMRIYLNKTVASSIAVAWVVIN